MTCISYEPEAVLRLLRQAPMWVMVVAVVMEWC